MLNELLVIFLHTKNSSTQILFFFLEILRNSLNNVEKNLNSRGY